MKHINHFFCIVATLTILLSSCSDDKYLDVIPAQSDIIVSFRTEQIADQLVNLLHHNLKVNDVKQLGIDYEVPIYAFQSRTGYYGLTAKVNDADRLEQFFARNSKVLKTKPLRKKLGILTTTIDNKWVVGFNDDAFLVMGPVTPSNIVTCTQQVATCFKQQATLTKSNRQLIDKIDSIPSPITLIARASALPESVTFPFTLGLADIGKNNATAKVYVTAGLQFEDNCAIIEGTSFSTDETINQKLQAGRNALRPITNKYAKHATANAAALFMVNVDGNEFLPFFKSSGKTIQSLLTLANTTIDVDKIINNIAGDFCLQLKSPLGAPISLTLTAQLKDNTWTNDVSYWKSSCPAGSELTKCSENFFCFANDSDAFYFGATSDHQFYASTTLNDARAALQPSPTPLPQSLQTLIEGKKMLLFVNTNNLLHNQPAVLNIAHSLLGDVHNIVYIMK